jgi:hypothetical protein
MSAQAASFWAHISTTPTQTGDLRCLASAKSTHPSKQLAIREFDDHLEHEAEAAHLTSASCD